MKLMHLSDLHVGKTVNGYSMLPDQKYFFDQVFEVIDSQNIDAVCIAGDIYDKAIPAEDAVQLFDDFLTSLARKKVKVFMISGNHDSEERLNFGSRFFRSNHVYIAAKYKGSIEKHVVKDDFGKVNIYMLPFIKASQVKYFYPDKDISDYNDAVNVVMEDIGLDEKERNVVIAHQFVTGGGNSEPVMAGSENASVLNVGAVDRVRADRFLRFDYAALGHIHSPQPVGGEHVRYAGSPIKYSLNEIGAEKTIPIIDLREKGTVDITFYRIRPLHEMRHVKGKIDQITDEKYASEDYMYVTLTDEAPVLDAMARVRKIYPNIMKLDYSYNSSGANDEDGAEETANERSLDQILTDFYKEMYDDRISESDLDILIETAKEAGI